MRLSAPIATGIIKANDRTCREALLANKPSKLEGADADTTMIKGVGLAFLTTCLVKTTLGDVTFSGSGFCAAEPVGAKKSGLAITRTFQEIGKKAEGISIRFSWHGVVVLF